MNIRYVLKKDLTIEKIFDNKYKITLSTSNKSYLIGVKEYEVLQQLDGNNNLKNIMRLCNINSYNKLLKLIHYFEYKEIIYPKYKKTLAYIISLKLLCKFNVFLLLFTLPVNIIFLVDKINLLDYNTTFHYKNVVYTVFVFVFSIFIHEIGHAIQCYLNNIKFGKIRLIFNRLIFKGQIILNSSFDSECKLVKLQIYLGGILANLVLINIGFIVISLSKKVILFDILMILINYFIILTNLNITKMSDGYYVYNLLFSDIKYKTLSNIIAIILRSVCFVCYILILKKILSIFI